MLTTLFYFTALKMKCLTKLTILFSFLLITWNIWLRSLRSFTSPTTLTTPFLLHYYEMEISDYAHYPVLLSLHLKSNVRPQPLRYITSQLLKLNIWLRSLRCFILTTIKMKSATMLTTLFYFSTMKKKSLTTFTTLFYFTSIKMKSLTTLSTLFYFTDYTNYAAFLYYS